MDQDRFDHLARLLGTAGTRRGGLRAALGLLGLGGIAATPDADARRTGRDRRNGPAATRKRRHECGPDAPCPAGYDCLKQGRKRRCSCSTGVVCAGVCCPAGQVCQDGACTAPVSCIAPGEPCKGVGKPCCDGRTCSSGQGGEADIACYVHKTGACQSTADCVYMTSCVDGRCALNVPPPAPLGGTCDASLGQQCEAPGAVCTDYDAGTSAPAGPHCTLPLEYACTGDPDCTCYHCGWVAGDTVVGARREERAAGSGPRLACCGPRNYPCRTDRNCCLGNLCVNGSCQPEACDVCASGCPYTTVTAAVADTVNKPAGSTITVAPGVYEGSAEVDRSLTIRACAGDPGVILQNLGGENEGAGPIFSSPSYLYQPATVTLLGLTLRSIPGQDQTTGIELDGSDAGRYALFVADCSFENLMPAIGLRDAADAVVTDSTFDGSGYHLIEGSDGSAGRCSFTATRSAFRNAARGVMRLTNVDTTLTDCVVSGGRGGAGISIGQLGGGIAFESGLGDGTVATLTLAGTTQVTDNECEYGGGVAMVSFSGAIASLVMTGASAITGNRVTTPERGGGVLYWPRTDFGAPGSVTASGAASRVFGNAGGAQCVITTDSTTFTPVANCTP